VIYLRAGLYAEGPSDYEILLRLIPRVLDALGASLFPGACEVGDTLGIDASASEKSTKRGDRIAAAIDASFDLCELFIIHSDGAGDPPEARRTCIDPGVAAARARLPERALVAVACVPVREIEAWLLADAEPFRRLLGRGVNPALPADPERDLEPKATLRKILQDGGARRGPESVYAFIGENVALKALRALPAYRDFEEDLTQAIHAVAEAQGQRG
jgi:hypothetical protein